MMAREILIRYQLRMRRVEISIEDPYCFSLVQVGGAKYTPSEAKAIRMSCTKAEALSNRKPFQPCNGGTTTAQWTGVEKSVFRNTAYLQARLLRQLCHWRLHAGLGCDPTDNIPDSFKSILRPVPIKPC